MSVLRIILKIAPFLYMALIWMLSSNPSDKYVTFSIADSIIKESLHLIEFAILYILLVLFFLTERNLTKKTNVIAAILACLYGLLDEIHQYFVPSRSATLIDLIKDVTGVTVCYWIIYRGYFLRKNKVGTVLRKLEKVITIK